jgi:hypothetical protein
MRLIFTAMIMAALATPTLADDLYDEFKARSNQGRYQWALALVQRALPSKSIGAQERLATYIVGCAKEFAPNTGIEFAQFSALCAAMAEVELR